MSDTAQVTRVTLPTLEAALTDALELFGEIEATLDRQIYPAQVKDAPAPREYHVTLTAAAWRKFTAAMQMLERAAQNISDHSPGEET